MSAESPSAESPDCIVPPAGPSQTPATHADRVTAGASWRGLYQVGQTFGEPEGRWFTAIRQDTGEHVWLRVSSSSTAASRHAHWTILQSLDSPHLQKSIEAHDGTERVEIWYSPEAPTLRRWRVDRDEPNPDEIKEFIRQMAAALGLLHARGLGHFGLRTDNIFVCETDTGTEFFVGGFDCVESFNQPDLIPIPVDPLYAPPEAAGLFQHSPGELLLAWDWWSLGRVLQELILGQHVVRIAPEELLSDPPRSRAQMAEALLFERDIGSFRAGAVEWMPTMDARVDLLLRGLLASAREGRWGAEEITEWLAGGSPAERYQQPRQQRFFHLEGRGHTPPEAAQILRGERYVGEIISHVFGFDKPGQFAHFLYDTRDRHPYMDAFEQATKLPQAPALKGTPLEVVHEIAANVALLAISGGEFLWRGQPLATAISALLEDPIGIDKACTLLRALAQPVVLDLIKMQDAAAARQLENLVKGATEAEGLLVRCALKRVDPPKELTVLWQLAWDPAAKLTTAIEALHQEYACTANAALEKIFATPHPTRGMQILIAWTSRAPTRYGYKTHPEVKTEKLAALSTQGHALAQLLFWHRLERALRAGPLLFGSLWPLMAGSLTAVLLLAVHVPGPMGLALGLVPFLTLALVRVGLHRWQAHLVKTWTHASHPWTWRDSIPRCRAEARAVIAAHALSPSATEAAKTLKRINQDIAALAKPEPYPPVAWPPQHLSAWLATAFSWIALAGLTTGSVWRGVQHPPSLAAHTTAWHETFHPKKVEKPLAPEDQKITWPYKLQLNSPFPPLEVKVEGLFEPRGDQYKLALARAHQLVEPYIPDTVEHLVAVPVEIQDDLIGLLFYDGKKKAFIGRNGVLIRFVPFPKQWLKIGDKYAIYIDK